MDYCNWSGNNWVQNSETPMPSKKGRVVFLKGYKIRWAKRQWLITGGKFYQDIDRALETNARSLAKNMPLLRGSTRYMDWGAAAEKTGKDVT